MKLTRILTIIALLVPLSLLAQDLSKQKFEKFTSKDGKFTVMFPGKPTTQNQTAKTELGDIKITMALVPIGNDVAFIVSFNDYPDAVKTADPKQLLEGVKNGNKGNDGQLLEDKTMTFGPDKLPAHKVLIKKPGEAYMKNMMIMKGTRLYQVMVVAKKDQIESLEVEKFYKSFELTK